MRFADATVLWWLLSVPLLAVLALWARRARRAQLGRFAGGSSYAPRFETQVSVHRRAAKLLLMLLAVGAGLFALARPQWGTRLEPVRRAGIDVIVVVDTSLSMAAEDLAPNRLGQARHEVDGLIELLAGNRVGLVSFAGEAVRSCPLTVDYQAVRLFLDALDAEAVPVPGTALGDALETALDGFGDTDQDEGRGRAIVLFSDGEDHGGRVEDALGKLKRAGVAVFAVGMGTDRGGPIPLRGDSGELTGYKKDGEGKLVTTRLEEATLRNLAIETGGRYYRATPDEQEVGEIAQVLSGMDASEIGAQLRRRYEERFQIPLAVGFLALLADTLLGQRRRNGSER